MKQTLVNLVAAINSTYWSSWQSTANFAEQLKAAEAELAAERVRDAAPELLASLVGVLQVIEAAGLHNLVNGVELGPQVWYVKASDAIELAQDAIAKATGSTP